MMGAEKLRDMESMCNLRQECKLPCNRCIYYDICKRKEKEQWELKRKVKK